jgi:hypothetical protein
LGELADAILTDRWALPAIFLAVVTGLGALTAIITTGRDVRVTATVSERRTTILWTALAALVQCTESVEIAPLVDAVTTVVRAVPTVFTIGAELIVADGPTGRLCAGAFAAVRRAVRAVLIGVTGVIATIGIWALAQAAVSGAAHTDLEGVADGIATAFGVVVALALAAIIGAALAGLAWRAHVIVTFGQTFAAIVFAVGAILVFCAELIAAKAVGARVAAGVIARLTTIV